jgi:hypothetical protein
MLITLGRVTIWFIWEFLLNRAKIIYFIILKFYWFINVLLALALQVSLVSESLSCSWLWCLVWQSFSDWEVHWNGSSTDLQFNIILQFTMLVSMQSWAVVQNNRCCLMAFWQFVGVFFCYLYQCWGNAGWKVLFNY